ncbi:MAG TPA: hypothetical protein DCM05_17050 [Elusimicrobia bacterium]|nr:hypothetical protein [Elusimicrobiota bacterium]
MKSTRGPLRTASILGLLFVLALPLCAQTVVRAVPVPVAPVSAPAVPKLSFVQNMALSAMLLLSPLQAPSVAPSAADLRLPTPIVQTVEASQVRALPGEPVFAKVYAAPAAQLAAQPESRILLPEAAKGLHQTVRQYEEQTPSEQKRQSAESARFQAAALFDGAGARAERQDSVPVLAQAADSKAAYLSEVSGLSGQELLGALRRITGKGFSEKGYGEARDYMYSTADNVTVNGVKGIIDAYSGLFLPGTSGSGGQYKEPGDANEDGYSDRDGVNAEHVWPQSFFNRQLPMRSDLHHLMATLAHPNSVRGHLPFGEVTDPEYSNKGGAKMGNGVFEPPDFTKGRVARAVLYFYARYGDRSVFQGDSRGFFGPKVEMLLRWNREHPPTEFEKRRNDLVERWQGNRNPFVDDPSLAERIGVEGFKGQRGTDLARARGAVQTDLRPGDLQRDFTKVQPDMPLDETLRQDDRRESGRQRHGRRWEKRHHGSSQQSRSLARR